MPKQEWRESLGPRIGEARRAVAAREIEEIARRSGALVVDGGLELMLLGHTYRLLWPELVLTFSDGNPCPEELTILVLDYCSLADGTEPTGGWIGFQELPNGAFYRRAFQGYTGDQLVADLTADVEAFRRAAEQFRGEPIEMGDAAYAFRVLPHVPLAVVWWIGDDEFPANATVLFDRAASHYLPTDGLAILGRMLCRSLAKRGRES